MTYDFPSHCSCRHVLFYFIIFIIGFIAHTKLQMERTRVANEVNSVAKGLYVITTYSLSKYVTTYNIKQKI